MKLRPYRSYRPSGVEWIGAVPEHWMIAGIKRRYDIQLGKMLQTRRRSAGDVEVRYFRARHVQWFRVDANADSWMWASLEERERFGVVPGDLLICEGGEGGRCAILERMDAEHVIQNALHRVRPRGRGSNRFLQYVLRTVATAGWLESLTDKATIAHLTKEKLGALRIPLAPPSEQALIARFLDHAHRRIRRYVVAKERLVELFEEQARALTHEAVTGQIDVRTGQPYSNYRDSGVEWLGKVPKDWEVSRLGRLTSLAVGFPFKSEGFTQSGDDIRLLRGVNIAPGGIRWDNVVRWPVEDVDGFAEYVMRPGDIVLGMDRPIIQGGTRVAVVAPSDVPSLLLQRVARIRVGEDLLRDFTAALLRGKSFSDYLAPIFTGISVPHLSPGQIKGFRFALPSLMEQQAIIEHVNSTTDAVQSTIAAALAQIRLLREYRDRLIADVVTGKLDVREAAASLPEVDPLNADDPHREPEARTTVDPEALRLALQSAHP